MMNPPDAEDFVRQSLLDADLTAECRRWLPGDDEPGKEVQPYGFCMVCRQSSWSSCDGHGPCQLIGVMAGYNAALRDSLHWLLSWPNPAFKFHPDQPNPVFKN